jgi:hypothetical protein
MARLALFAILLIRQPPPGEVTFHLLEGRELAAFNLANSLPDLFPFRRTQLDLAKLRFDHVPDELPDFAAFTIALFIADRGKRHVFFFRKTKRDAFLSHYAITAKWSYALNLNLINAFVKQPFCRYGFSEKETGYEQLSVIQIGWD